ncbi:hypothetical protein WJX79_000872 [Trebouxia sp. C0005]
MRGSGRSHPCRNGSRSLTVRASKQNECHAMVRPRSTVEIKGL